METKLTLRLDHTLIEEAKILAKKRGLSISRMLAQYIKSLMRKRASSEIISPIVSEISGILSKSTKNKKIKKTYYRYLEDKYK